MTIQDAFKLLVREGFTVAPQTPEAAEKLLSGADAGPEVVTTVQASRILGKSPEWWADAAKAGHVTGAWREGKGAPWNLPLRACRSHLAGLSHRKSKSRSVRRGPLPRQEEEA